MSHLPVHVSLVQKCALVVAPVLGSGFLFIDSSVHSMISEVKDDSML